MFLQPLCKDNKLKNVLFFGIGAASAGLLTTGIIYRKQIKKAVNKAISTVSCEVSKKSIKDYFSNLICKDKQNECNCGCEKHHNRNTYSLFTDEKVAVTVIYDAKDINQEIKKDIITEFLEKFYNIESISFLTSDEATEYFYSDNISDNTTYPVLLVYGKNGLIRKIENSDNISVLLEKLCNK
ncbi:MAG: hypothetical protein E7315_06420 [Clostridiales bacterium]|nr:hypothetical protein [Clostridiales bacterium]